MAQLLEALPAGALGVDLDPAGLLVGGHSPQEAVAALGKHIIHVTANDATHIEGQGIEVQLGRGSADVPALMGSLEEHAFRGWLTISRRSGDDPVRQIGESVQFLESL